MGFLDFLKKNKPPASEPVVDLSEVEKKIDGPMTDESPVEAPPMYGEQEPHIDTNQDVGLAGPPVEDVQPEDVPLPPPNLRDPTFDEETPDAPPQVAPDPFSEPPMMEESEHVVPEPDGLQIEEHEREPMPEMHDVPVEAPHEEFEAPQPEPEPPVEESPAFATELPDFSDEDMKMLDEPKEEAPEPEPVAEPVHEEFKPPEPEPQIMESSEPEGFQPPADAPEHIMPPKAPKHPAFRELDHGMFLSDSEYFTLRDDVSDLRKKLRKNDSLVGSVSTEHERVDVQLKRIADNMNTVQERLISIDGALFEE